MKPSTTTVLVILAAVLVAVGVVACTPADLVKVNVPAPIVKELGMPAGQRVPLSQLDEIQSAYQDHVESKLETKRAEATAKAAVLNKAISKSQRQWSAELARVQAAAASDLATIQDEIDTTTAEASAAQTLLTNETKRTLASLEVSRRAAQEKADAIGSLLSGGLNLIAPALSTAVPGAGLALTALAGAVGLFTRKPGDAASWSEREAKHAADLKAQTDAAYDAGKADALAAAHAGAGIAGATLAVPIAPINARAA